MNQHYALQAAKAASNVYDFMERTGTTIKGHKIWSSDEISILRDHYPDVRRIREMLPHRSEQAIRHRCLRLGIVPPKRVWTAAQISKLRRLYTSATREEIQAAFPNDKWTRIADAAFRHGFRRPRRRYVRVPCEQMNAIRERCFELGYTAKDLDALAGTKNYFENGCYHPRPNMRMLERAVRALDGTLIVTWND